VRGVGAVSSLPKRKKKIGDGDGYGYGYLRMMVPSQAVELFDVSFRC